MAKARIEVVKTYEVTIDVPREEIDIDALYEEAKRLVEMADSNVIYKGIRTGSYYIEYSDEEKLQRSIEENAEQKRWNKIAEISEDIGIDYAVMSMGFDDERKLLDNEIFCDVPHRFVYDGGWGKTYEGPEYSQSDWQGVLAEADRAIKASGDKHHVFLESVIELPKKDGVKMFALGFGS